MATVFKFILLMMFAVYTVPAFSCGAPSASCEQAADQARRICALLKGAEAQFQIEYQSKYQSAQRSLDAAQALAQSGMLPEAGAMFSTARKQLISLDSFHREGCRAAVKRCLSSCPEKKTTARCISRQSILRSGCDNAKQDAEQKIERSISRANQLGLSGSNLVSDVRN